MFRDYMRSRLGLGQSPNQTPNQAPFQPQFNGGGGYGGPMPQMGMTPLTPPTPPDPLGYQPRPPGGTLPVESPIIMGGPQTGFEPHPQGGAQAGPFKKNTYNPYGW